MLLSVEREEGNTEVMVLPITHLPPSHASWGVEIPEQTRIRLGLDHQPSWVITTELNRFNWPGPDIRRVSRASDAGWDYGMLPPKLFEQIRQQVLANNKDKKLKEVERTE